MKINLGSIDHILVHFSKVIVTQTNVMLHFLFITSIVESAFYKWTNTNIDKLITFYCFLRLITSNNSLRFPSVFQQNVMENNFIFMHEDLDAIIVQLNLIILSCLLYLFIYIYNRKH